MGRPAACRWAALATLVTVGACSGHDAGPSSAAAAPSPKGPVRPPPAGVVATAKAVHRAGQTFLTWPETGRGGTGRFHVYRALTPLGPAQLAALDARTRLHTLPPDTGRASTDRWLDREGRWSTRYLDRWVIESGAAPLPPETGLYVFTVHADDLGGAPAAGAYYAVTAESGDGSEVLWATTGPVEERVSPPEAVRAQTGPDGKGHVYVQFMDLRRWNPTFHAPRAANGHLGLGPTASQPAYAYTYLVSEPSPASCPGGVPRSLPVFVNLHGWGGGSYRDPVAATPYYCAFQLTPTDFGETWWFGFAEGHDYGRTAVPPDGTTVVNYTEQRVLRMLADLRRDPVLGSSVDPERVYVWGHSMGGSGALALASRYPQVFAAAYASQPMTHPDVDPQWTKDMVAKWGRPEQRLGVRSEGPEAAAAKLGRSDGTPVFEWQRHGRQIRDRLADEVAPFGISHGRLDTVLAWPIQGRPVYAELDAGRRAWAGAMLDAEHTWAAFNGLPPTLGADRSLAPFKGFKVRKDETVPGLSGSTGNAPLPPPDPPAPLPAYNTHFEWSASWHPWHERPVDEPSRWCMSLRTTDGRTVGVGVTPRRTQAFRPAPGSKWRSIATYLGPTPAGAPPSGTAPPIAADADGLLLVPVDVTPEGVRLCLEPG